MTHNLHFIAVVADDGEIACDRALEHIEGWGDDNNWRQAVAAICRGDGEVYVRSPGWVSADGYWEEYNPDTKKTKRTEVSWKWAAALIEEAMRDSMVPEPYVKGILDRYNAGEILPAFEYYSLKRYFDGLYQAHSAKESANWYINKSTDPDAGWQSGGELVGHLHPSFVHKIHYFGGHYDRFGISCSYFEDDDVDPDLLWLVLIDMHS